MYQLRKRVIEFLRSEVVSTANIGQQSAVLTLATLFALVPLVSTLVWFVSQIPTNQAFILELLESFLSQLIPEQAINWQGRIDEWNSEIGKLKTYSLILLMFSVLFLVNRVDSALHWVFQVDDRRGKRRWLHYLWIMPVLILCLIFCMTLIMVFQLLLGARLGSSLPWLSWGSVFALWVLLVFVYQLSSRNSISLQANIAVAFVVTLTFMLLKSIFAWLYVALPNWSLIFGVFSALPLFMLWCQLAWSVLLFGALFVRWFGKN